MKTLLMKYKLTRQHEHHVLMDTDDSTQVDEIDTTESGCRGDTMPVTFIQLWPVFEHLWLLQSYNVLKSWLDGHLDTEELSCFVSFGIQFTGTSPVDITVYRGLENEDVTVGILLLKK